MMQLKVWATRLALSKFMWLAFALTVFGAIEASLGLFADVLTPKAYAILSMVVGVIVAILRFFTTMPLKDK